MKKIIPVLIAVLYCAACKKEDPCVRCTNVNQPPLAQAGSDTSIILPLDTLFLDGSASFDPDGSIVHWFWTMVSGPIVSIFTNTQAARTGVANLTEGTYLFELKVTDKGGLSAKDTVQVTVLHSSNAHCGNGERPLINVQLTPIGTLSQPREGISAAAAGNKILFVGSGSARVDIFDVAANTWSTAELSSERVSMGIIAAGNKVFFAGGQDGDGYSSNVVDIYDVGTNTWYLSQLSRSADGLATATTGNKVFFAGGNWGVYAASTVDIYNLTTNTWSTANLSTPRNFITAVSATDKVYFTGGDPWTGQASSVIDIYDNKTGVWSTSSLQVPRAYHAAVAVNNVLYFAGGKSSHNTQPMCSVETLHTKTGARTSMSLSGPGWFFDEGQNVVVNDSKLIFQKYDAPSGSSTLDIYDIQTNTWSVGILPMNLNGPAIISVNNTIYVAGGSIDGVLSDKVWRLEF